MSTKLSVVALSVALLLVLATAFLFVKLQSAQERLAAQERLSLSLGDDLAARDRALQEAQRALQESEALVAELRGLLATQAEQKGALDRETSDPGMDDGSGDDRSEERMLGLTAVEEAGPYFDELLAKGDLEGLWLLAADLLRLGEPGYEKVIALAGELDFNSEEGRAIQTLWGAPEMLLGRFLADASDSLEDLLGFGLHLISKNPGELPKDLSKLRKAMLREPGVALLGLYRGSDSELLGRYVEMYRGVLAVPKRQEGPVRHPDLKGSIRALGQIPTEASTDLLLDLLEKDGLPSKTREDVVRSLAWQRSDRALPALRGLLRELEVGEETTDGLRLRATVVAAVRLLE